MYEIHIKGKKIAVLLALENAVGYSYPEITFEKGDYEQYIVHCELETKWDTEPFGDDPCKWDGKHVDLDSYTEESINNGDHCLCFQGVGAATLSGMLGIQIEILNRPDDSANPFCNFNSYENGNMVESSRFKNPDFDGEETR